MSSPLLLLEHRRRSSNIARWIVDDCEGSDEEDAQNRCENLDRPYAREAVVCMAPAPMFAVERRVSEVSIEEPRQPQTSTPVGKYMTSPRPPALPRSSEAKGSRASSISASKPSSATGPAKRENTARNNSKSVEPRLMWEKRLAEAAAKEKQAQAQINELQRKVTSLEQRIRVIKNAKQKEEGKGKPNIPSSPATVEQPRRLSELDECIVMAVRKVIEGKELCDELQTKITDAVSGAVAQTLLQSAAPAVKPPSRKPPPPSPSYASSSLALI